MYKNWIKGSHNRIGRMRTRFIISRKLQNWSITERSPDKDSSLIGYCSSTVLPFSCLCHTSCLNMLIYTYLCRNANACVFLLFLLFLSCTCMRVILTICTSTSHLATLSQCQSLCLFWSVTSRSDFCTANKSSFETQSSIFSAAWRTEGVSFRERGRGSIKGSRSRDVVSLLRFSPTTWRYM